ncbi:hypothetical protein CPB84DRAFT_1749373 [Gymnopilus junonius]|uniref:Uncharacterized protein n=1 Tax=Gymnopilus junonius TaxID=109634 RepID=A0A9P5NHT8_GYMJU|nr:hypothetical protein CPB84DRAFT_1749373 [Gymnopilus junonius]
MQCQSQCRRQLFLRVLTERGDVRHMRLKLWIAPEFVPMVYILKDLVRAINSRAPNLRAIFLCGLHWSEISADVTQSLLDLLLRPSIVRLELHDMTDVPRRIISDCVSLQFLELNANFVFASAPPGTSSSESGICNYLRLAGKYRFAHGPKTHEQIRELEQLFRTASSLVSFDLNLTLPRLISSKPNFDNFVHFPSTAADLQSLYLLRDVHLELGWGDGALSLAQSFIQGMPANLASLDITFTADILWFQYPFHEIRPVNMPQQFLRTRFPGLREATVRLKLSLTTLSEPFSPLRLGVDEKQRMEDVFRAKIGSLSRAALEDSDLIHPTIVVEMRGAEDLE